MRLVKTKDIPNLTGLSLNQIREWTSRRLLFPPDVKSHGSGSQAQFSWQTILLLRIAASMREEFHIELEAFRENFILLRSLLQKYSFIALRDKVVIIESKNKIYFATTNDAINYNCGIIILPLNSHLKILSEHFGILEPQNQFNLFPLVGIR